MVLSFLQKKARVYINKTIALLIFFLFFSVLHVTDVKAQTNVALNKPATASSVRAGTGNVAANAVDGNATGTRWESEWLTDPQWIYVDLGVTYNINRVKLTWEAAYATNYEIQVSNIGGTNNADWTTIKPVTGNASTVNDWTGLSGSGRYVRMYGTTRSLNDYGYSIWEMEVYGNAAPTITSNGGLATAALSVPENTTAVTTVTATDENVSSIVYSISGGEDAAKFNINAATGVLTFQAAPNFESPQDVGSNNTNIVTVRATDNGALFDEQIITVTITNVNEPPVANNHTNAATLLNTSGVKLLDALTGTDDGSIISFQITQVPVRGTFSFTDGTVINTSTVYSWEDINKFHDRRDIQYNPSKGNVDDVFFTFTVTDNEGATSPPATFTILINGEPEATTRSNIAILNTAINVSLNPGLAATDDGTIATFKITELPSGGILQLNGINVTTATEYNWSDRTLLRFTPSEGSSGTVTFKYTVKDNEGVTDSSPAIYSIPINVAPVTGAVATVTTISTNNATAITAFSGTDTAPGTIAKYIIKSMAGTAAQGTLLLGSTALTTGSEVPAAQVNNLKFDPADGGTGTFSFTFAAVDNQGAEDLSPETYNIAITNNPRPVTDDVAVNTVVVNGVTTPIISTNNYIHNIPALSGTDPAPGSVSNFIIKTIPDPTTQGKLYLYNDQPTSLIAANSVISFNDRGGIKFQPVDAAGGTVTFTYAAVDNQGAEDLTPANYNIAVVHNTRPVATQHITSNNTEIAVPSTARMYPIPGLSATDADAGSSITGYKITYIQSQGMLYINGFAAVVWSGSTPKIYTPAEVEGSQLTWDPKPNNAGTLTGFAYKAIDNYNAESPEVNYTIYHVPDNPAKYNYIQKVYFKFALTNGFLIAYPTDADGSITNATLTGALPAFLTLNTNNGDIRVNNNAVMAGTYNTTVTLTDNKSGISTNVPVTLTITNDIYQANGTATKTGENCYQLTPDLGNQAGQVWRTTTISLNEPFEISFNAFLGTQRCYRGRWYCLWVSTGC